MGIELRAPGNPYRDVEVPDGEAFGMSLMETGRGLGSGPGLLGADIDRIARHHHAMGRREAEMEADTRIEQMNRQLAVAYDEGFAAARVEVARGLARHTRGAVLGAVWFPLLSLREGPKSKAHAGIDGVLNGLREVTEFLDGVEHGEPDADAEALIADGTMMRRMA
jgi:hypothetical protein